MSDGTGTSGKKKLGRPPRNRKDEKSRSNAHYDEWSPVRARLFAGGISEQERDALIALYGTDSSGVDDFLALEQKGASA